MKLRDQAFLAIFCLCALFFGAVIVASMHLDHGSLLIFSVISLLFLSGLIYLTLFLVLRRISDMIALISEIHRKKAYTERIRNVSMGSDELTPWLLLTNQLLSLIESTQDDIVFQTRSYSQKLEKYNSMLERKSSEYDSKEKEAEELKLMTRSDSLTSLPNRMAFNEALNESIALAKKTNKKLAVLLVNLDNFKTINDELGFVEGDKVIKEITGRYRRAVSKQDFIARFGGALIVILLKDIESLKSVDVISEKLLAAAAKPININRKEVSISMSIGACIFPDNGTTLEELLKHADIALFRAKRAGGRVSQNFTKEVDVEIQKLSKLEIALRSGLTRQEFVLHFQPKFDVKEGLLVGAEALVRWESLALGVITPGRFLPLLEDADFNIQLGEWVLNEACAINKKWQNLGYLPIPVSVNLSYKQFHYQKIAEIIANALKRADLKPEFLEIEIKEADIMGDVMSSIKKISAIKHTGVKVAIDHFGTSDESRTYLKQLPVDFLKLDQGLVKQIHKEDDARTLTSTIIEFAHQNNQKVVALGVECSEQMQFLIANQCDIVQGYLFSMPLSQMDMVAGSKLIFT